MYKLSYPKRDTSVYERYPERNTGVDQILEIKKYAVGEPYDDASDPIAAWGRTYNSRIFIQFDLTDLQLLYDTNTINTASAKYYLTLFSSEAESLQTEYTLYAYPLAQSWVNGNGYYNDEPEITNGASWYYRDSKQDGTNWSSGSGTMESVTVSGGGSWNSSYEATQSFSFESPDIRMDVTNIVDAWLSGTIPNHGFVIKHSTTAESNFEIYGSLKFFGRETHTIYIPKLEAYWSDPVYTGSFTSKTVASYPYVVYTKNLKSKYTQGEVVKIRLGARDQYPTKTYSTSLQSTTERKLPNNTLFSIVDYVTQIPFIPFDSIGTKVRMDNNGHFIIIDTQSLLPVRYYKILFKIFDSDGVEEIIDNNISFRVER